jgi:hypothetical protein
MKGEFKIKEKIGKPIYAHIKLTVTENVEMKLKVNFDNNLSYEYEQAIEFGILYYFQQYLRYVKKTGLTVHINYVHGMPVDTTTIVLAYSSIQAMANALSFSIEGLSITENGDFVFPKGI